MRGLSGTTPGDADENEVPGAEQRHGRGRAGGSAGRDRPGGRLGGRAAGLPGPQVSRITDISHALPGQNAEVEEATDPRTGFAYAEWIAANGIGFARSTDGGYRFSRPILLPRSAGGWDPAVAVARTARSTPRS
jgi:hypothetical protein